MINKLLIKFVIWKFTIVQFLILKLWRFWTIFKLNNFFFKIKRLEVSLKFYNFKLQEIIKDWHNFNFLYGSQRNKTNKLQKHWNKVIKLNNYKLKVLTIISKFKFPNWTILSMGDSMHSRRFRQISIFLHFISNVSLFWSKNYKFAIG